MSSVKITLWLKRQVSAEDINAAIKAARINPLKAGERCPQFLRDVPTGPFALIYLPVVG